MKSYGNCRIQYSIKQRSDKKQHQPTYKNLDTVFRMSNTSLDCQAIASAGVLTDISLLAWPILGFLNQTGAFNPNLFL